MTVESLVELHRGRSVFHFLHTEWRVQSDPTILLEMKVAHLNSALLMSTVGSSSRLHKQTLHFQVELCIFNLELQRVESLHELHIF